MGRIRFSGPTASGYAGKREQLLAERETLLANLEILGYVSFKMSLFLLHYFFPLYVLFLRATYTVTGRMCFYVTPVSVGALTRSLLLSLWTRRLVSVSVLLMAHISLLFFRITFS